jgi:hypothetical protein
VHGLSMLAIDGQLSSFGDLSQIAEHVTRRMLGLLETGILPRADAPPSPRRATKQTRKH